MTPRLAPSQKPTVQDIYWAAGIYEGEGTCNNPKNSEKVAVSQKDTWLLYRLQELFGGAIYPDHKPCSVWNLSGARARGFLQTIYMLLSPRRQEQIRKCLRVGEYGT